MKMILAQLQARSVSQRRACRALGTARSSARYCVRSRPVNELILVEMKSLARRHRRYGSPRMHALLRKDGHAVNHKRVERLYREAGLTLPRHRPRRRSTAPVERRLVEATRRNEVWSYDFVHDRTQYGEKLKMLVLMDEYSRECLEIRVEKQLRGQDVLETLDEVMNERGRPTCIRSDNGPEFKNRELRKWLETRGVTPIYIEPGSPWQNGLVESLNGKLRDECLNEELFYSRQEAQTVVDWWRQVYNEERPHMSLGYKTPREFAAQKSTQQPTSTATATATTVKEVENLGSDMAGKPGAD